MATKKITDLTALGAAPATTDLLPLVDVSDTTDAATGTTKSLTVDNLFTSPIIWTPTINSQSSQAGVAWAAATTPKVQTVSTTAGMGLTITADNAVAGSTNAGAAAGGSITITAGDAARKTSGTANGGDITLATGAGIGGGTKGVVIIQDGAGGSSTNAGLQWTGGQKPGFYYNGAQDASAMSWNMNNIPRLWLKGNTWILDRDFVIKFATVTPPTSTDSGDLGFSRDAAGVLQINGGTASTTKGAMKVIADANGSYFTRNSATEQLTLATGATTTNTSGSLAPALGRIMAIVTRVTTTITTAANYGIKVTGGVAFNKIGTASTTTTNITAGNTDVWVPANYADQYNTSATTLTVTTNVNPGAGAVRITILYEVYSAPTS